MPFQWLHLAVRSKAVMGFAQTLKEAPGPQGESRAPETAGAGGITER